MQFLRLQWGKVAEDHLYEDSYKLVVELQQRLSHEETVRIHGDRHRVGTASATQWCLQALEECEDRRVDLLLLHHLAQGPCQPPSNGSTSMRGNERATIKAHPATPHHPRPYGNRISPGRMESPSNGLVY